MFTELSQNTRAFPIVFPVVSFLIWYVFIDVDPQDATKHSESKVEEPNERLPEDWLFDQLALQKYLLVCAQDNNGGFKDKPDK